MSELSEFLLARIAEDEEAWRGGLGLVTRPDFSKLSRHMLAECEAKRRIVERLARAVPLPEWTPDCGGDWCLSVGALSHKPGVGAFANYWPDNTVSASVYVDGEDIAESGIVARSSRAECQAFAEQWIREHLSSASPVLRDLALPYADHEDYREEWRP